MEKQKRIKALDAFRGITIAAMIMVNQPGSWSFKYEQMAHSAWTGCTLTDLIFPFFLIIIGVAMWFAFQKYEQKFSIPATKKIIRRTILIFLIGIGLNIAKQITGVLQRIAICYGIGAMLCISLKPKQLFFAAIGILLGYWFILWGYGETSPYAAEDSIVGKIDTFLVGKNHLRSGYPVDASGLFGSIPAIVHILWGYLLGRMISKNQDQKTLVLNMFLLGIPAILLAQIWNYAFPINKTLWTSSYVLYTTGCALITLAFFVWIIDVNHKKRWISPLIVFGVNPLFAYVFAELWATIVSNLIKFPQGDKMISLKSWLFSDVFSPLVGNLNGSLLYSVFVMVFYWSILWILHKRKIYIKI
jgi:predicted acyltransferase